LYYKFNCHLQEKNNEQLCEVDTIHTSQNSCQGH
jgi:hypothetical protein